MRRWLLVGWLCLLVACSTKDTKTTAPTPQQLPQDIDALELRLAQDMSALGLAAPPPDSASAPILETQPNAKVETLTSKDKEKPRLLFKNRDEKEAKKSEQTQCQRTCDLVDSICDASERICQLTEKMPSDPEAPKRCERAKNSCERAKMQGETCGCSP